LSQGLRRSDQLGTVGTPQAGLCVTDIDLKVTRNVHDFAGAGIDLLDPWTYQQVRYQQTIDWLIEGRVPRPGS
jgi:hypothetical protein